MTLARRGIIAGLLGALAGCAPAALLNTTVSRKGYTLEADIPYGRDARQKLDLYRPDTPRADGKAVIFFYGGSWESGTKSDYLFVAQALAANGLTVVAIKAVAHKLARACYHVIKDGTPFDATKAFG